MTAKQVDLERAHNTLAAEGVRPIAPPAMQEIDINLVQVGERIRAVSHAQVESLKASIADVGLLNPITVYRCSITRDGEAWTASG